MLVPALLKKSFDINPIGLDLFLDSSLSRRHRQLVAVRELHGSSLKHLDLLGELLHLKCLFVVLVDVLIDALNHKVLPVLELHET